MKKRISGITDMINQVAFEKQRAAASRFKPRPAGAEDPRQVYLSSCELVAEAFLQDRYRFTKSGPRFTKKNGPWKYEIAFQSSHNNVAGVHVALWCYVIVSNSELKRWRLENNSPFSNGDRMGGGQIGNLLHPPSWYDWELASVANRKEVIQDIIQTIRSIALPFLGLLSDVDSVARQLEQKEIPGLDLDATIETLLWSGKKEAATQYIDQFLTRRPDLKRTTCRDTKRAMKGELGPYTGYSATLARAITHYGLQPKIPFESVE